jgi:hypothetical protein
LVEDMGKLHHRQFAPAQQGKDAQTGRLSRRAQDIDGLGGSDLHGSYKDIFMSLCQLLGAPCRFVTAKSISGDRTIGLDAARNRGLVFAWG